MTKISFEELPEVIVSSTLRTKQISKYMQEGKIRKLASRLYTKNLSDLPEAIVKRNLWSIVGEYFPGGLIADRTAIENKPAGDGSIFLVFSQKKEVQLPGITLRSRKGPPPLPTDRPFIGGLFLSSPGRALLENIKLSRKRKTLMSRTLSRHELEEYLDTLLRRGGVDALNRVRDEASKMAKPLRLETEWRQLDALIGGFLGTRVETLHTQIGTARQLGMPYDPQRLELFLILQEALATTAPLFRAAPPLTPQELTTLSFFEAYFSNFIEGTEFELQEAYDIIFQGNIPLQRPADAHDILGTFQVVSDIQEMSRIPKNFDDFIHLLKTRHALIMQGRPEKLPGQFKQMTNRAGSTVFVDPELVLGTLKKGLEIYQAIDVPLYKAIFMMFLIAEVHPFTDGNGRMARVMMNAELVASSESRILIPTVYRNNYLSALRALSLNQKTEPLIRVLEFAQKYTQSLDWSTFSRAQVLLQKTHAFWDPHEAEGQGIRLILPTREA